MIIDNALIGDIALGSDKNRPTEGDSETYVPASIQPIEKLLRAHHVWTPNTGQLVNGSIIVDRFESVVALGGATNTEMCTLPRGLWTVNWSLEARFDFTTLSVDEHVRFNMSIEAFTRRVKGFFARVGVNEANGSFRLLNVTTVIFFLSTTAAAAAQNFEASLALNIERNI